MKKLIIILAILFTGLNYANAQLGVNSTGATPASSAMLDVTSTSKGLLIPRMTTVQRTGIASPVTGLLVYDIDLKDVFIFDVTWKKGTVSNAPLVLTSINTPIKGVSTNPTSNDVGVWGETSAANLAGGTGVYGLSRNTSPSGHNFGVYGETFSTTDKGYGVYGKHTGTDGVAIQGESTTGTLAIGVQGVSPNGSGVKGLTTDGVGVSGIVTGVGTGVIGLADTFGSFGVWGASIASTGVYATTSTGIGFWGRSIGSGTGGLFESASGYALITGGGNVGIGTPTPTSKLEVNGQIKITGGTPGTGKVLTSDGTGLATWTTPTLILPYSATQSSGGPLLGLNNTGSGQGILGTSNTGAGVYGQNSSGGAGVQGVANTSISQGVLGQSIAGIGVFGDTNTGLGVLGKSNGTGVGGTFESISGLALKTGTGNVELDGFTKLGSDATTPKIKMKKLTGTTAAGIGNPAGVMNVAHGLVRAKIIAVNIIVKDPGFVDVGPGYTFNAGYEFQFQITTSNIVLINTANGGNITSKNFSILITYEE